MVIPPALRERVALVRGEHAMPGARRPMVWLPRLASQLVVHVQDGVVKANVSGPSTRAVYKHHAPGPFYLQLVLAPGALPARALVDRVVDLEAVWGRDARRVIERVDVGDPQATLAAIAPVLAARLGAVDPLARQATAAIGQRVAALADALGASERGLRRVFGDAVGLSPKRYARLARVLRVVAAAGTASWARLAVEHGFYDQAHLSAEFRAFLGVTPGQYLAGQLPFR